MRKLGFVVIVAAGLYALLAALQLLSLPVSFLTMVGQPGFPGRGFIVLALIPTLGCLALGLVLIWRRQSLADRWFKDSDVDIAVGAPELLRIGLLVAGVAMFIQGFTSMLARLYYSVFLAPQQWLQNAASVLAPVLAALLVVFSRPLSVWLWTGRQPKQSTPQRHDCQHRCPACGAPFNPADYRAGIPPQCSECGGPLDFDRA
jgi:hypothetical protein